MISVWDRLTEQLREKYFIDEEPAREMAKGILVKRGHLDEEGNLTSAGKERSMMDPEERAIDRSINQSGGTQMDYVYNPETNTTRKVRGNGTRRQRAAQKRKF